MTKESEFCAVPVTHNIKQRELAETIKGFKDSRNNLSVPNMENQLVKKTI